MSNIAIVVCKPTDLTGLMTPGPEPDGGSTVRRRATVCAQGAGNLIL